MAGLVPLEYLAIRYYALLLLGNRKVGTSENGQRQTRRIFQRVK
jgi:hypothetical protein